MGTIDTFGHLKRRPATVGVLLLWAEKAVAVAVPLPAAVRGC